MTGKDMAALVFMALCLGTGITIAVGVAWFEHRTRTRALDVLRVYAERGEEPPASVLQALTPISGWPRQGWPPQPAGTAPKRSTRGRCFAHAAANTVFAGGLSWLAWWRFSATGEAGPGVIVAILAALFFAAALAAQLVGAYYAPD
jgi:hypothetical protein